jgi:PAS domain S-box-containing protein
VVLTFARVAAALAEAARASQEQVGLLLEASVEGIVVHEGGRHVLTNSAFARLVGYDPAETVGRSSFDFVAPESHELMRERMATASEEPYEVVGLRRDGRRFDAEVIGKTVEIGGRTLRVVAVRDVTERKRMETALRASEERYRSLFDRLPAGLYRTRPDGQFVDANPALAAMLGYADPAELLKLNASELYVDRGERWEESARLEREGTVHNFPLRLRRRDGRTIWVEDTSSVVRASGQAVVAYEGCIVDVTERRRVADNLRLLTAAGVQLAASLDYDATMAAVAQVTVPAMCDWCTVYEVDPGGTVRRGAVAYADPAKERLARALREFPPSPTSARSAVARAIDSGRPDLTTEIPASYVEEIAQDEKHLAILRELGFVSSMTVPLMARGRVLGALALFSAESGRRFGPADLELAEDLARRAALALDNARLYREAQEQAEVHVRLSAELRALAEQVKAERQGAPDDPI